MVVVSDGMCLMVLWIGLFNTKPELIYFMRDCINRSLDESGQDMYLNPKQSYCSHRPPSRSNADFLGIIVLVTCDA